MNIFSDECKIYAPFLEKNEGIYLRVVGHVRQVEILINFSSLIWLLSLVWLVKQFKACLVHSFILLFLGTKILAPAVSITLNTF